MKYAPVLRAVLLLFIAASVVVLVGKHLRPESKRGQGDLENGSAPGSDAAVVSDRLIVYCFHVTMRCPTCLTLEACVCEALQSNFADQLRDGRIEFRTIDVEQPDNEHFRSDYQLVGPAVVLVRLQGGKPPRWENLLDVLPLLAHKTRCVEYIRQQVQKMMEGKP